MKKLLVLFTIITTFVFNVFSNENNYFLDFNTSDFEVSSFLTEGTVEYSAKCLSSSDELPWVPNDSDKASLIINNCDTKDIVISSGYVSKNRPDLYEKNARPKIVLIEYLKSNKSKTVELKDTDNPQTINIFSSVESSESIKLTFIENYKGTKYSDLCVNYICKAVCKRTPTVSADFDSLKFTESKLSNTEGFWDKNLKINSGKNVFYIYNNNNFPEVRINDFIVNFDIRMDYCESVIVKNKSATEYEFIFFCDDSSESFIFDFDSFKTEETGMKYFDDKC